MKPVNLLKYKDSFINLSLTSSGTPTVAIVFLTLCFELKIEHILKAGCNDIPS